MSRIGKRILTIPQDVEAKLEGNKIIIKGPLGTLDFSFSSLITVEIADQKITVKRPNDLRKSKMLHGTTNSIIENMLIGVSKGYKKELEINGVGYNVVQKGNTLVFSLGYSHKINLDIPENLKVELPKNTRIIVSGIDKQLVGQYAAKIKGFKRPEPYGGKGIKYADEVILRKAGKASSK